MPELIEFDEFIEGSKSTNSTNSTNSDVNDRYIQLLNIRKMQNEQIMLNLETELNFDEKNKILNCSDEFEYQFKLIKDELFSYRILFEDLIVLYKQAKINPNNFITQLIKLQENLEKIYYSIFNNIANIENKYKVLLSYVGNNKEMSEVENILNEMNEYCNNNTTLVKDINNYITALQALNNMSDKKFYENNLEYFEEIFAPVFSIIKLLVINPMPKIRGMARKYCNIWSSEIF